MNRYKDFDTAVSEQEGEPIEFTYAGMKFTLPASLPAIIPVKAIRLKKQYGSEAEIPDGDKFDLALALFGEPELDRLLETGISMDKLGDIIAWVLKKYSGEDEESDPGNPPAPEEEAGAKA